MSDVEPTEEMLTEENEALESALALTRKRLAAMREVGMALAGRLDLDQLLHTMIGKVSEITECDRATLFIVDEEQRQLWSRVAEGLSAPEEEPRLEGTTIRIPIGAGIAGYVAQTGTILNLPDAYEDARFDPSVDQETGYKTRSVLAVPILSPEGKPMGVVEALNKHEGTFTVEDERLLEAIGHQMSLALTDALMFEELKQKARSLEEARSALTRRVSELDLLVEIEASMAQAQSADALLEVVLTRLAELIDADGTVAVIAESSAAALTIRAATGLGAEGVIGQTLTPGRGLIGRCVASAERLVLDDATRSEDYDPSFAERIGGAPGPLMLVPLLEQERSYGAVEVFRKAGRPPFSDDDMRLLSLLTSRIAGAIQAANARTAAAQEAQLATIGRMLSGVVHDFRTPMTVISGYVQLMQMASDEAEREEAAGVILKQTDLMSSMIKELLQFARGETDLLLRKVYMQNFAREQQATLGQFLNDRGVRFSVDLQYRGAARFDESKVSRALMNLARNSVEAFEVMSDDVTRVVELCVSQVGDQIEFAFSDNAGGVPAEIEGRLFESFATHGKAEGTGLGLAVVKKIVGDHHGTIRVDNRPGEGVTFRLRLPL